jgi:ActR/RegA family two-component response regulator
VNIPKRLLIVEDDRDMLELYQGIAHSAGLEVVAASTAVEGLGLVRSRTCHAALVDIMLNGPDDLNDRGGVDVIRRIDEMDEGTRIIVLSGTDDIAVPVELLVKYRVFSYIIKPARSRQDIIRPVKDALDAANLRVYGRFRSLIDLLSVGYGEMLWVNKALIALKTMDGYSGLSVFVNDLFGSLAPLLPRRGAKVLTEIDEAAGVLRANLWSKALGKEVQIIARHASGKVSTPAPEPPAGFHLDCEYQRALVDAWVYCADQSNRDLFVETIEDVPLERSKRRMPNS